MRLKRRRRWKSTRRGQRIRTRQRRGDGRGE